jgi:C1A family cysteine protease
MLGVRGVCKCIFFLVLISGFIFPVVFADESTNITNITALTETTVTETVQPEETQILTADNVQETLQAQTGSFGIAPINPAFLAYQEHTEQSEVPESRSIESSAVTLNDGSTSHVFLEGEIPSPVDLSYTKGMQVNFDDSSLNSRYMDTGSSDGSGYPGRYDLRSYGKVSSVKDQGSAGSCWAFAPVASLESFLLPDESWDFSENNMKNTLARTYPGGFNRSWDGGGNEYMATAYLTRWSGPVLESDDPYSDSSGTSPTGLHTYKHIQNVYFLPYRSSATDNDDIKDALMNYGAVKASIYWTNSNYSATKYAFYNGSASSTNHAITIVGWDDTYSSGNFTGTPAGNGAFIVKNSWGTAFGDNGYFYVSYYDATIGDYCVVFTGEPVSNYDRVYSYDPLGWVSNFGFGTPDVQFANVFTTNSSETLRAIGLYTNSPGSYTAKIYIDPPVTGPINATGSVSETSWTNTLLGYQTIDIPDVSLKQGQNYSIVVSAVTTGYGYPVAIEYPILSYSPHATARAGQSYFRNNTYSWSDLTGIFKNSSVCLKGYTTRTSEIGVFRNGFWILDGNGNFAWDGPGTGKDIVAGFGTTGDKPVVGNWNQTTPGDKIGVFRSGTWYIDYNGNFAWDGIDKSVILGQAGDVPVIGDWNGNGNKKIGVFRDGFWILDGNGNYLWDGTGTGNDIVAGFGMAGDVPVIADWLGTGKDKIGVFRNGFWILDGNGNYLWDGTGTGNDIVAGFGAAGDVPVVKDWNGDGLPEIAVFRASSGEWIIDYNGNYAWDGTGTGNDVIAWLGQTGDVAVAGDWSGTGTDKFGVFRNGFWILDANGNYAWDGSGSGKDIVTGFGTAGDIPVVGKW